MEGLVILAIVAGLFLLLVRSIRERALAGYGPVRRSTGRRDHVAGVQDADFDTIVEESRSPLR